jgi:hypothetical protein
MTFEKLRAINRMLSDAEDKTNLDSMDDIIRWQNAPLGAIEVDFEAVNIHEQYERNYSLAPPAKVS